MNFGTTNAESLSNLLLSLTAGLIAFLELVAHTVCPTIGQDDTGDSAAGLQMEGHSCLRAPLSQLRDHLLFIEDRQVGSSLFSLAHLKCVCSAHHWSSNIEIVLDLKICSSLFLHLIIVIIIVMQAIFEDDCTQVSTEKELIEGIEQFLLLHRDVSESLEG